MAKQRVRRGWRRERSGLDVRYHHIESGWMILHCGHPTANWPYYGLEPGRSEAFTRGGFGKGYAFRHVKNAQESIELYLNNNPRERTTTMEKAVKEITKKKKPGKRLDKKTHKLVAGKKSACGKPIGEMEAGIFSGGVTGRDTWHFVDCKECLTVMPEVIHSVNFHPAGLYGCMEVYDDRNGVRWKAATDCGASGSPLSTTTDNHASVNCMDCLSKLAPMYRRHFIKEGGSQTSTKCGAKTNSQNEYSTDCWWLCTCPDCYRINEATPVHPMQEDDVQLLLHNSMVAARNQEMVPTQNQCVSCAADTMAAKTTCLACAVLTKRGISTDDNWEEKLSRLFNLPYEWVMDLLKGWDGDKAPELTYPSAFKLGKRLWRKHGQS